MRASAACRREPASATSRRRRWPAGRSARCATATRSRLSSIARRLRGLFTWWATPTRVFGAEEGARRLAQREPRAGSRAASRLPDDTRLWAALVQASGGVWGGCVYDVDQIVSRLEKTSVKLYRTSNGTYVEDGGRYLPRRQRRTWDALVAHDESARVSAIGCRRWRSLPQNFAPRKVRRPSAARKCGPRASPTTAAAARAWPKRKTRAAAISTIASTRPSGRSFSSKPRPSRVAGPGGARAHSQRRQVVGAGAGAHAAHQPARPDHRLHRWQRHELARHRGRESALSSAGQGLRPQLRAGAVHSGQQRAAAGDNADSHRDCARRAATEFSGATTLAELKRAPADLVEYLFRENTFPSGAFLMTGTGIVPPDDVHAGGGRQDSHHHRSHRHAGKRCGAEEPLRHCKRTEELQRGKQWTIEEPVTRTQSPRSALAHCVAARHRRSGQLLRPRQSFGLARFTDRRLRHLRCRLRLSFRAPTTGPTPLCQLPIGVVLDKFGVRRVGRIGTFLWSVASFAAAASRPTWADSSARAFCSAWAKRPHFPPTPRPSASGFPQRERSFATSLFDAAAKFASAIGVPLIGIVAHLRRMALELRASPAPSASPTFSTSGASIAIPDEDPELTDSRAPATLKTAISAPDRTARMRKPSSLWPASCATQGAGPRARLRRV